VRPIEHIIIHCAATKPGMDIGIAEIRDWHVKGNGWRDVGYHYCIRRSGDVEPGRSEHVAGAHVAGHNWNSIGICLVGGIDNDGKPEANYTEEQWAALEHLVTQLLVRYPAAQVSGHNNWTAAKACPCFDVKEWWAKEA
jgi:N-acetylmuramoyl-L-alanine amidase